MPVTWIANHLSFDDSYLLLRVAEGWAETGRPTFDGLHPTNGFQAAWGILVWLIAEVAPGLAAGLVGGIGAI